MTKEEVVIEICKRAWALGVAVFISPTDYVTAEDNVLCSGYFDPGSSPPHIAVAANRADDRFLGTLLHEFGHVEQWVEGSTAWIVSTSSDDVWEELAGKRVRNSAVKWAAQRDMEADCERRAVRLIKELKAPVDIDTYCRAANAYLHFYNILAEKKQWFTKGKSPYDNPKILEQANSTLDASFIKTPAKLRKALLENCF